MNPDWVWLIFVTAMGGCVGSFLNVVIYRLPAGMSVVSPPSRCPNCEQQLAWYDNVPVLGWLWLRGKCRTCKNPISIQYPTVEALVALMFGGTYVLLFMTDLRGPFVDSSFGGVLGVSNAWPIALVWLTLLAGLFAATVIDARYYIIPLEIPWVISATAVVALPVGVWLSPGLVDFAGSGFGDEPFLPYVGHTGAMVAWGGAIGLALALLLRWVGIVPDSFEGEDDFDIETDPPEDDAGSRLTRLQRLVVWLAPAGFILGIGLNAYLQVGAGKLPGLLHIVAGGIVGYLVVRVVVLGLQFSVLKNDSAADDAEPAEEDDVPPLKHPRRVVLKECFFIGFPLLGMFVGHYLARHVWTEPISEAGWYGTLGGVVLGFLVGGGVIWAIRILGTFAFGKEAMGMGDIHLLAAIGAVIGWWESIFLCIFVAPFLGLAVVLMTLDMAGVVKKPSRQIPYGPYLAGAAALILLLGMGRVDLFGILESFQPQAGGPGYGPSAPLFVP
ncbi:MAG: A24 family peptidase [Phycisphaerales bacterium JB063]